MKKAISILLAVIIAASIFTAMPVISSAAGHTQTEKESNDNFSDAQLITLGNTLTGDMPDASDPDFYKFISNEDGKINISIDNLTPNKGAQQGNWSFFLYESDSYNKLIGMAEIDLVKTGVTLPFIGAQAGHYYYLQIYAGPRYASKHSYRIRTSFTKGKFYEKECNNTEFNATKAILANKYTGTIGGDHRDGDLNECVDRDYYDLKAPAKGTMTLTFSHKNKTPVTQYGGGWYLDLYKHHNGGNLTVSSALIAVNKDPSKKLYKATIAKNAEFWLAVKSGYDPSYSGYGVLPYASDAVGEPYTVATTFVLAAKPKLSAKATKNSITLTSKKLADVTGYEIQMKSGSKFKKIATTKKPALSYKKSGLKKNTKYSFKVRAYLKKDGTTYYGNWVSKTAKTKKK
ncbi:MAG: fibronectin type III domain-containing protein [Ruminococcus sp.]|nr:fibronectin type III domain-containing protein [Ruminococcus sp.]